MSTVPITTQSTQTRMPIEIVMEEVERLHNKFKRSLGGSSTEYIEKLCLDFIKTGEKEFIHEETIKLDDMLNSMVRWKHRVLQLDGMGSNMEKVQEIANDIRLVLNWASEIFCHAMIGVVNVTDLHNTREFDYQKS